VTAPSIIPHTLLAVTLAGCCLTAPPTLSDLHYPGTLQSPTKLPTEAVWQQHVVAAWRPPGQAEQERSFDAALQRQGETLTVVGLSPLGTVGFSIQQSDSGIAVVNNIEDQLAVPPEFILLDVQRTFFPWNCPEWQERPVDGIRRGQTEDEEILETWRDGRLQQRSFRRLDNQPEGLITVTYDWQQPDWVLPTRATLDNAWFGYQLTITTNSETRLEPEQTPTTTSPTEASS